MTESEPIKFANRNDEAQEYLEKHKINDDFLESQNNREIDFIISSNLY